ncbi:MAG: FliM/FliN family flagellar motor switch protein [Pirellulales bacterium]|nr:FliM/FliN family flagellar motor switch protein [Pirellulales bacterium]
MADLTPEIVDDVVAACTAGAGEAGEAFSRALDAEISVSVGNPGTLDLDNLPEGFSGPGLAVVLMAGGSGALLLLPESAGLVPAWCADPDPTGASKLTTLAQELGMLVLPEQFMPDDFKAACVKNLMGAIQRGGVDDGAAIVPLELSAADKQGTASLIWPAPRPTTVVGSAQAKTAATAKPPAAPQPAETPRPTRKHGARLENLPEYTRSLLRVKVPVVVTLAEKRQPLGRVVEIGPGSILQFDKSCEDMLDLDVGEHRIATGEAVKIGDKFGLRITSMILPEERFKPVKRTSP